MPTLPTTWSAPWITSRPDVDCPTAAPIFRREWRLPAKAVAADLHISGLGTANVTINGQPIDDSRLGPGQSDYEVAARAVSVDVSDLVAGQDTICAAVDLGRGFYDMHSPNVWQWATAPWRDTPRLTAELHVTLADGNPVVLTSDETWKASTGGTRFDSLYEGESWDQSLEPNGWRDVGFDDSVWASAVVAEPHPMAGRTNRRFAREVATSGLPLRQAMADPIRVRETLDLAWTHLPDGRWVGDIGRVVAGWVRVTPLAGPVSLTIKHGELLEPDGHVRAENRFVESDRFQTDEITLDAEPWEARHTWKGFRYLEVTGADPTSQVRIEAQNASADIPVTGTLRTSHPTLQWVNDAFVATSLANMYWIPTDTPTYEKNGWTGDLLVALPAMLARMDMSRMLASWLDDFLDAQAPDGMLPVIIPSPGWGYGEMQCAPAPEWTTIYPALVEALEREYGLGLWDLHRDGVVAYVRAEIARIDEDGLAVGWLGDYLSPGTNGGPPEDLRFHASIALIKGLDVAATALAGSPEATAFAAAKDSISDAVNRIYLDSDAGSYSSVPLSGSKHPADKDPGYRQGVQVQALDAGIVPDVLVDRIVAGLVADIESRDGRHNVGCLAMARLCSLLVKHGHGELALRVASNPTAPSWEAWRRGGHSTLLEQWVEPVRSRAHYFQGAGIRFIEEDLAGLRRTGPSWQTFSVTPAPIPGIDDLSFTRGPIDVSWTRRDDDFSLAVTVPADYHALITLPDGQAHDVVAGRHDFACRLA